MSGGELYESAELCFLKIIEKHPNYSNGYIDLGNVYMEMIKNIPDYCPDLNKIKKYLKKAVELDTNNEIEVKARTLEAKSSPQVAIASSIWDSIKSSQPNAFKLDIEIFGYRIISTNANPIEYDEYGQLSLKMENSG